jgi:hypothetical protein
MILGFHGSKKDFKTHQNSKGSKWSSLNTPRGHRKSKNKLEVH